jgi:hypothetical protein
MRPQAWRAQAADCDPDDLFIDHSDPFAEIFVGRTEALAGLPDVVP